MDKSYDIKIYGCHSRDENINLCKGILNLKDSDIVYDDRPTGGNAYYTFRKALLEPVPKGVTHRLVLPDDMQLCEGFQDKLEFLIDKFPKKVIELYPFDYNFLEGINPNPYYRVITLAACGIVFPVQIIKEMIDWIDTKYTKFKNTTVDVLIDDTAVQTWCNDYSVDVITTVPSIVQHIGDKSLLGDFPIRRTNYFWDDMSQEQKDSLDWNSDKIQEFHCIGISKGGKPIFSEYSIKYLGRKVSSLGDTF